METSNGREPHLLALHDNNKSTREVERSRQTSKHQTPVVILINIISLDTSKSSPQNKHNYLKHFRNIYEEKGWMSIQCTPTEDRLEKGEASEIVSTLFACLQHRDIHKNPIIIHVVGHEGLPVYNALCQFAKDEQDLGNTISIKGCILDSCPKQPGGLMESIREFWPSLHDFLMLMIYIIRAIYPELFDKDLDISEYDKFCCYSGTWPQLYLYSIVDHIVPHKGVEKVISLQRNAGVPVAIRCWNDTEHARHLFIHEQEYTELCQHFVEDCTSII